MTSVSILTEKRENPRAPMPLFQSSVPRCSPRAMSPRRSPVRVFENASDSDLVAGISERDADALAEVYRRHGGAVFGLSKRVLGDDSLAEDVTQELFVRLWNEPGRFDSQRGTLRSFLQRQAHSRSVERVRSEEARRRREDRSIALDVEPLDDFESRVVASIDSERVRRALDAIESEDRRAIVLAYYGGLSYREVALRLGLPEGTVKSRIRAGLRRLASILEVGGTEEER